VDIPRPSTTTHDTLHRIYYEHVRRILLAQWDPLTVAHDPDAQDEYDSYTYPIVGLLMAHTPRQALVDHLIDIARNQLGVCCTEQRTEAVVDALIAFRETTEAVWKVG
jgi:hypothetical protein